MGDVANSRSDMRFTQLPDTIRRVVNQTLLRGIGVILAVMVVAIFYQVIARYVFNAPPSWTEELARYLQIWLVALSVGPLFETSEHITIDFVSDRISEDKKKWIKLLVDVLLIVFLFIVFYLSIKLHYSKRPQRSPALEIPMAYIYLSIPVMTIFSCMNIIVDILHFFKKSEDF